MYKQFVYCVTRARGADFRVGGGGGGLIRTRKRHQTRGSGGMVTLENLKLNSSELARNAI